MIKYFVVFACVFLLIGFVFPFFFKNEKVNIDGLSNRLDGFQNASPFQASVYLNGSVDIYNIAAKSSQNMLP